MAFSTHTWVISTCNIFIGQEHFDAALSASIAGNMTLVLPTPLTIDVLDFICYTCRLPADEVADQPCTVPIEGNAHLRGGPVNNTRRPRVCRLHKGPWADCAHLHAEPYGRPPMPDLGTLRNSRP